MKILVFSDSHLGPQFEENKYEFLKKIISEVDQVIINGDFWDGFLMKFDKFVESPWKKLFPLFKSKQTVYLYGNHDLPSMANDKVMLFSDIQGLYYQFTMNDQVFHIEHGNRFIPLLDESIPFFKLPLVGKVLNFSERILVRGFGKRYLESAQSRKNVKIKDVRGNHIKNDVFLICGHTHYAELDEANKFANTGIIRHGLAQYLIIEDGKVTAYNTTY
jgi:UDP-2,3-diacylglucosamine pyrophosphatase LpxH